MGYGRSASREESPPTHELRDDPPGPPCLLWRPADPIALGANVIEIAERYPMGLGEYDVLYL